MPFVAISVAAGRDPEALRACLRAVHEAVRDTLGAPDSTVRVVLTEVPPSLWSAGGRTLEERRGEAATAHTGTTAEPSPGRQAGSATDPHRQ
ncbi:4-oxalocrotonate tautomerase family protein [Streptomyces sp. NPDC026672]|uniref:tautomerase family protein n=1 Tax=unclassified Streptomyces TaxID=2593676 RepID=UPI0034017DD8